MVNPSETVRTLVKFTDYTGVYLLHCHNLEHEDDGMMMNFRVNNPTGVENQETNIPSEFRLHQNYPNPFNPSTRISFDVPVASDVELEVFNMQGQKVATLIKQSIDAGRRTVEFNAVNAQGGTLPSGAYIVRMVAGRFTQNVKMTLIK